MTTIGEIRGIISSQNILERFEKVGKETKTFLIKRRTNVKIYFGSHKNIWNNSQIVTTNKASKIIKIIKFMT